MFDYNKFVFLFHFYEWDRTPEENEWLAQRYSYWKSREYTDQQARENAFFDFKYKEVNEDE
tara:strand:- start:3804 stop:3986 length:183 start_codon:yes stop_codon:yes gene_type:complete